MKRDLIEGLFRKFNDACYVIEGIECWSARELQVIFNYTEWRNFLKVIEKAKAACENAGITISYHFVETNKMINLAKGAQRNIEDFALTRYACYLIAQNGDPAKPQIAFAQNYFAVKTREKELIEKRMLDMERVIARGKLSESEKKLSGIIYERGIDEQGFAIIRSKGDAALFGGFSTNEMKKKYRVPGSRPLADFLPTLTIKAKDFATELTSHNIIEKNLKGENPISLEHTENNAAVRKILIDRGVKPETLPPAEDIKKVRSKLDKDEKQILLDMKEHK